MRKASQHRKTTETDIRVDWTLDGAGKYDIKTSIAFLDHMLELFCKHGYFNLSIEASGDTDIDDHHLVEDLGITLGTALKEALGNRRGITRYGSAILPMDEALVIVGLDLSNRPFLNYDVTLEHPLQNFDENLIKDFFAALTVHAGMTLHIKQLAGENTHHILEAIFKGFARALHQAITAAPRETHIPSTKGLL
jgi:imidazoleglycerol-phosphate dehydratase